MTCDEPWVAGERPAAGGIMSNLCSTPLLYGTYFLLPRRGMSIEMVDGHLGCTVVLYFAVTVAIGALLPALATDDSTVACRAPP